MVMYLLSSANGENGAPPRVILNGRSSADTRPRAIGLPTIRHRPECVVQRRAPLRLFTSSNRTTRKQSCV